jgi:YD repeat-containing protein
MRVWFIVAMCSGCWRGDPAEPAPVRYAPPPIDGCPLDAPLFEPFAHDLFPGCPPAPLPLGVTCPAGCDMPCRSVVVEDGTRGELAYYYLHGRLAMVKSRAGSDLSCTIDTSRITCDSADGPREAHFDEHGRIDRLELIGRTWRVIYDDQNVFRIHIGNRVLVIKQTDAEPTSRMFRFGYGGFGRLSVEDYASLERQTNVSYGYDERGRLAREITRQGPRVYRYDRSGSLASIFTPGTYTTSRFDYDARGRVTRVVTERGDHRRERTYEYCR